VNLAKRSERIYSQKPNLRSEANWFIIKFYNIEAKRTGSIVILSLKQQQKSEFSFFFKTNGKKRKGSIVNYRSFAITTFNHATKLVHILESYIPEKIYYEVTLRSYAKIVDLPKRVTKLET
jgi:hypothetical protein